MENFNQTIQFESKENTHEKLAGIIGLYSQGFGKYSVGISFENEDLSSSFENFDKIEPDSVLRPVGDTTIFTTAGIQHLETIERDGDIKNGLKFKLSQPVVRSQFMDKIQEGYSTAFVNFTAVSVGSTLEYFAEMCKEMIKESLRYDKNTSKYSVTIHDEDDRWGNKKFTKTVVTLYYENSEVSEGLFIDKFPKKDLENIAVAEVCWGEERFKWTHGEEEERGYYFEGFDEFYENQDPNIVAKIIDPVRTATLMLMQGVVPAHIDPGFRLRQLIKRIIERNMKLRLSVDKMAELSYKFWKEAGVNAATDIETVNSALKNEMERAYNVYLVNEVENKTGKKMKVDVNQGTKSLLTSIVKSAPEVVARTIQEVNRQSYDV